MDHTPPLPTCRIAVVDDHPTDVSILQRALQRAQLRCVLDHFPDGEAAIQAFVHQGAAHDAPYPDLIVLDLHLRHGSGAEVLQYLRAHPVLCRVPVIVWTGHSLPHARLLVGDVPVDAYVIKTSDPTAAMEVGTRIKDILTARWRTDTAAQA
jgi:chemotaxis family two-component system response regulator Rcp1